MPHPADGALIGVQVPDIPGLPDMLDHLLGLGKRVIDCLIAGRGEGIDRFYVLRSIYHDIKTLQLDNFPGGHHLVRPNGNEVDPFLERGEIDPVRIPFQIGHIQQLAIDSADFDAIGS